MADIVQYIQGNVSDEGKVNWRSGDSAVTPGDQSIYDTSSVQLAELGQIKVVGDRIFKYAQVAATFKPGQPAQNVGKNGATTLQSTAGAADVAGQKQVTFFFSSAAASGTIAANFYAEGMVYLGGAGTSTQMGMAYRVKSHSAITTSGNGILYTYDPLKYTTVVTDNYVLQANKYANLTINTGAAMCPGIVCVNATTGDYTWIQVQGPCPCMITGTGIDGTLMTIVSSGLAPLIATGTGAVSLPQVGVSMVVQTSAYPGLVWLNIGV